MERRALRRRLYACAIQGRRDYWLSKKHGSDVKPGTRPSTSKAMEADATPTCSCAVNTADTTRFKSWNDQEYREGISFSIPRRADRQLPDTAQRKLHEEHQELKTGSSVGRTYKNLRNTLIEKH